MTFLIYAGLNIRFSIISKSDYWRNSIEYQILFFRDFFTKQKILQTSILLKKQTSSKGN